MSSKHNFNFLKLIAIGALVFFNSKYIKAQNLEYFAKASFIEKFARFTEWPAQNNIDTFRIIVFGKCPIEMPLSKLAQKYTIKNKPISIRSTENRNEIIHCNVLFISAVAENQLSTLLQTIQTLPILTVSDSPGFGNKGVHFNFYNSPEGSIYFEINPSKLKSNGLKVDMYLLELGRVIK